jgi:hypothetical protein
MDYIRSFAGISKGEGARRWQLYNCVISGLVFSISLSANWRKDRWGFTAPPLPPTYHLRLPKWYYHTSPRKKYRVKNTCRDTMRLIVHNK